MLDSKGSHRAAEEHAKKEATACVGKLPYFFIQIVVIDEKK